MFKQKSRLSLVVALAMGAAVTGCGRGTGQQAAADTTATSTPATTADEAIAPAPSSRATIASGAMANLGTEVIAGEASSTATTTIADAITATASKAPDSTTAPADLPLLVVTKSPTCGCCHLWVEHMQKVGFKVEVHDVDDINLVKARVGVPYGKGSCHTAEVGGYFVEGHVPAEDVKRLLAEKPDAKGLTVPGMPMGSPGMEVPDGRVQPYAVELVARDGSTSAFAHHGH